MSENEKVQELTGEEAKETRRKRFDSILRWQISFNKKHPYANTSNP